MPVISVRVDRRTYEALVKLAEARKMSLYSFVKTLLEAQVSSEVSGEVSSQVSYQVSSEVSYRELERKLSELTSKVSYLEEKIKQILDTESITTSTGNITRIAGNVTTSRGNNPQVAQSKAKPEEKEHAGEGYEWCRSKAKIRNLQSFLKWVDDSFGLIDWWDEGDRYCFKTRRKPAKTD